MKTETQKTAVFVLFLVILSVLIYYLVFNGKKDKSKKNNTAATTESASTGSTGSTTGAASTEGFPLKNGMKGKYVKALQKGLNQKFFTKLLEDGDWGTNTQKAVEKHLDPISTKAWKPSVSGVLWSQYTELKFDKLV